MPEIEPKQVLANKNAANSLRSKQKSDCERGKRDILHFPLVWRLGILRVVRCKGHRHKIIREHEKAHVQHRKDHVPEQEKAGDKQAQHLHDLGDLVDDPGEHALIRSSAEPDRLDNDTHAFLREHDTRGGFGDICGIAHCNPHFGLFERRGIVDAVACHAHYIAALLQKFDNAVFVLGENLGKTIDLRDFAGLRAFIHAIEFLDADDIGADACLNRNFPGDGEAVARQHDRFDIECTQVGDHRTRIGADGVGEREDADEFGRALGCGALTRAGYRDCPIPFLGKERDLCVDVAPGGFAGGRAEFEDNWYGAFSTW